MTDICLQRVITFYNALKGRLIIIKLEEYKFDLDKLRLDQGYAKYFCTKIRKQELQESEEIFCELIEFAKNNNLDNIYPWILNSKAWLAFDKCNYLRAIELHKETYRLFNEKDDKFGCISAYNGLMCGYNMTKELDKAIEYGILAIELAESIGAYEEMSLIKANVAEIYRYIGEFKKSKEILEEVNKLSAITYPCMKETVYLNTALCEFDLDNLECAMNYANKAYESALRNNDDNGSIFDSLIIKSRIYIKQCQYDLAENMLIDSSNYEKQRELSMRYELRSIAWAELYLKKEKFREAIAVLEPIIDKIKKTNVIIYLTIVYSYLNEAYEGLGDINKAYYYHKKLFHIEKEIYDIRSNIKTKDLEIIKANATAETYKLLFNKNEDLYEIGKRIIANLNSDYMFELIAKEIKAVINYNIIDASIFIDNNQIIYHKLLNDEYSTKTKVINGVEDSFEGYCIRNRQALLLTDVEKEKSAYIENIEEYLENNSGKIVKSAMFVPITVKDDVLGVISVKSFEKNMYKLSDITTLKILSTYLAIAIVNSRLYKEVEYAASFDTLTNIYNRRELFRRSSEVLKKAETVCVIITDVDNFKTINDKFGHQTGDRVLKVVARKIKSSLRSKDLLGRYGGEEFMIVLYDKDTESCRIIAERIREAVASIDIRVKEDVVINTTISIGIANVQSMKNPLKQIISYADKALYSAKNTGKNKVVIYGT